MQDFPEWPGDPLDFPTFRMTLLSKVMDRLTIRQLADNFDISYAQWRVIARLGSVPEGLTVSRIAEQAWVDRAEVSRAASVLESRGYLTRKTHPKDRRAIMLVLTKKGKDLCHEVLRNRQAFHERLVEDLTPSELKELDRLIQHLRRKLEQSAAQG